MTLLNIKDCKAIQMFVFIADKCICIGIICFVQVGAQLESINLPCGQKQANARQGKFPVVAYSVVDRVFKAAERIIELNEFIHDDNYTTPELQRY